MLKSFFGRRFSLAGITMGLLAGQLAIAAPTSFVEQPGILEFSGTMIVRPLPLDRALTRTDDDLNAARTLRQAARDRVSRAATRYYPETDEYIVPVPYGSNENKFAEQLLATGAYDYVHPNYICYVQNTPNDTRFGEQWHHATMQSALAWDTTTGSPGVTVAIVDTGTQTSHPDLSPNLVPGYNAWTGTTQAAGGLVDDEHGHGTHTAGCAAARGNNSQGVTGMGWNMKIMPVRVTAPGSGGSTSLDAILLGARWAADNGAKVVSSSWSGITATSIRTTGNYIKSKGALYCYAAGNDAANLSGLDYANVIVVGATDSADAKAGFSAFGTGVDVFAPGVNILSTTRISSYGNSSGTSMATPIVAGAIGMLWSAFPALTADQIEDLLDRGCRDLGDPGDDSVYGWGRINVAASIALGTSYPKFRNLATNRYYELVPARVGWSQAVLESTRRTHLGVTGSLGEPNTFSDLAFFTSSFTAASLDHVWVGGVQAAGSAEPAGGWGWRSGRPFIETSWAAGQPDNAGSAEHNIFLANSGGTMKWADGALNRTQTRGFLVEYAVPIAVTGQLNRPDWVGAATTIPVELRDNVTGNVLETANATVSTDGTFSFTTLRSGVFQISVKGDRWLRRTVTNQSINGNGVVGLILNLVPGDTDGDNAVTVFDYDALSSAFDTSSGQAGFNAVCDFDGDGSVTVFDYDLLSANFDAQGD